MPDHDLFPPLEAGPTEITLCRRTDARYLCERDLLIRFVVRPSFANIRAYVRDISRSGIGLLLDRPLEAGSVVALRLSDDSEVASPVFQALVVQSTPLDGEGWLIGCQLVTPLREKELDLILEWFF